MLTLRFFLPLLLLFSAEYAFGADPSPSKNVLLLVSDDCRAGMSCYGGPGLTPNIDKLARTGRRFERAYCQYALCNPSRTSFLTGLRPDVTGVVDNAKEFRNVIPDMVTLPEMFRNGGYSVARIGKLYHYGVPKEIGTNGLDDPASWEHVWNPRGRDCEEEDKIFSILASPNAKTVLQRGSGNYGGTLSWLAAEGADEEQTDGKIAAQAQQFLRQKHKKPFFLAVGFFRPHTPYVSPKSYFEWYPQDKVELPEEPPGNRETKPKAALSNTARAHYGMDEDMQRSAKQAYLASMSFMDAQFGIVLAELEKQGLDKNTIVIFISDHGYSLGEHGLWQKRSLYEDSARVPLIIRDPGMKSPGLPTGRTAELIDLYPTLADLCGLKPDRRIQGTSLKPVLENPDREWNRAAFTQVVFGNKKESEAVGRSVRTERYRYTEWNEGRLGSELYDHAVDPKEFQNLAQDASHANVVEELRALLGKGTN
jgi:iduronate 2-sulfatase